ncbi:MAG: polymer-forming cytoskeletal protein [Deltaproteobacteria bacterium]|nr:polymer-forming cytoskeletal protein [Deltaproteobacteria bacterium]
MATIVGDSSLIKGHLEGDEDLTVFGRVEGSVRLSRTLMVEPSGIVKAEVSVRNAVVNGVVVGNITASDAIELTEQARVVGDLTAPRVIIVDGASFRGQVDMGDLDIKRPATSPRPASVPRPVSRPMSRPAPAPAPAAKPAPAAEPAPKAAAPAPAAKKAPAAPPKPPRRGTGKQVKVKKKRR